MRQLSLKSQNVFAQRQDKEEFPFSRLFFSSLNGTSTWRGIRAITVEAIVSDFSRDVQALKQAGVWRLSLRQSKVCAFRLENGDGRQGSERYAQSPRAIEIDHVNAGLKCPRAAGQNAPCCPRATKSNNWLTQLHPSLEKGLVGKFSSEGGPN